MWIRGSGSGSTITERWIRGSGSTFPNYGSQDPDPRQNEMDPKRCIQVTSFPYFITIETCKVGRRECAMRQKKHVDLIERVYNALENYVPSQEKN